jgi:T3SS negative regulator,GrlR
MVEGFWILRIERPEGSGGVVLFMKGKLFGGDNGFAWTGTYQEFDKILKGTIAVHHFDRAVPSILGIDGDYELHFSGDVRGDTIIGTAIIAAQPQHSLGVRLTKMADL